MTNRKALQELQIHIARRLQQAESQAGVVASWLGVRLGQQKILLPLQQSGEIHAVNAYQRLPYTKPWFIGVTALRSHIYGVIELSAFLRQTSENTATPEPSGTKQRLIAVNDAFGVNAVLRVDELEGLRAQEFFVRSEPAPANAPDYYGSIFYDAHNVSWHEINLQALLCTPQFLEIADKPEQQNALNYDPAPDTTYPS